MVDVRPRPEAVGPIDELRLFTLTDFRRLDHDPRRATERLKDKVHLLQEESYTRLVEGLRAWRMSPVNQLYLAIGQASLEQHLAVADIIRGRTTAGQPTLTEQEFEAVMDLNKELRI